MNNHPVRLGKTELLFGFMVKTLMGVAYGWIFFHYYHGDDTWKIHAESLEETKLLLYHPAEFFRGYLPVYILNPASGEKNPFTLFLYNIEYALIVKTLAVINLLSRGNYYINTIFFNGIIFWGHYWLFNLLNTLYPEKRKWLYAVIFLFMPVVFWLSGIRSDGLLFFFLSLMLSGLCRPAKRSALYTVIGFAGIFIIRIEFAAVMLVAVIAYLISMRSRQSSLSIFITIYAVCILVLFGSMIAGSRLLSSFIVHRQHEFLQLRGTEFHLRRLESTVASFIKVLPQAVNNSFFRPYLWEAGSVLQVFYSLEILTVLILVVVAVRFRHADWKQRLYNPVILLFIFFSVSIYVLIGYTVPFPGAIIRYKCIPELLLVCSLIIMTDFKKILN